MAGRHHGRKTDCGGEGGCLSRQALHSTTHPSPLVWAKEAQRGRLGPAHHPTPSSRRPSPASSQEDVERMIAEAERLRLVDEQRVREAEQEYAEEDD